MAKEPKHKQAELTNEVATVARDFIAPAFGGVMHPNDDTLLNRGQGKGLKIYDDIERDGHAYAVIQKRKMAVIAREWVVEPASSKRIDQKAAEVVRAQLTNVGFDILCLDLLDALLKGYAVSEVMWQPIEGGFAVSEVKPKDQRRFRFNDQGKLRLLVPENQFDGIAVPERKFLVHRFGAKDGNPYGLGLGHKLFWPVFFKRQGITFWLTFADKFGSPTAIGEYPASASPEERAKLMRALMAISQEAGVMIPSGMIVKFLEAARSGSVDTYEKLIRYMDEQISETVLGETLTTNIGGSGSRAASETHNDVREELCKADADLLSDTLNKSLVVWLTELNVPGATPPKIWRVFDEPEDETAKEERNKKRAERDQILITMGFEPTPEYVRETYGEGWTWKGPKATPPAGPGAAEFAERDDRDVADRYADRAGGDAALAMNALVDPVRRMVMDAGSLEEIRDGLLDLYPRMNGGDLSALMREAMGAAHLAGRFEVRDGR